MSAPASFAYQKKREPAFGQYVTEYEALARRDRKPTACRLIGPKDEEFLLKELENKAKIADFLDKLAQLESVGGKMTIKKYGSGERMSRMHAHATYGPGIADNLLCFVHQLAKEYAECHRRGA
jgi:hypothetical protein